MQKTASVASLFRPCLMMKSFFCLKAKNGLGRFALSAVPRYKWNIAIIRTPTTNESDVHMYHAACKIEFQPFNRSYSQLTFFVFCNEQMKNVSCEYDRLSEKMKNVSCEYDRLNCWNSTLQAAWYIRQVCWTWLFDISFIIPGYVFCESNLRYDY